MVAGEWRFVGGGILKILNNMNWIDLLSIKRLRKSTRPLESEEKVELQNQDIRNPFESDFIASAGVLHMLQAPACSRESRRLVS